MFVYGYLDVSSNLTEIYYSMHRMDGTTQLLALVLSTSKLTSSPPVTNH